MVGGWCTGVLGSTFRKDFLGAESSEVRLAEFKGQKDLLAGGENKHPESGGRQGGLWAGRGGQGLAIQLDFARSLDFTLRGKGRVRPVGLMGVSSAQRRPRGDWVPVLRKVLWVTLAFPVVPSLQVGSH